MDSGFRSTPTTAVGSRVKGLDTLRALAIVMVILLHTREILTGDFVGPWLKPAFNQGWAGVDLFFVLSGFLIGGQIIRELRSRNRLDFRRFYLKRAFRILPAYYAVLLLYVLWPAFREKPTLDPAWRFALFLMNYGREGDAFSHAWSLCVEEHFYLIVPAVALASWRWPRILKPAAVIVGLVAGGALLRWYLWRQGAPFFPAVYRPTHTHLDGLTIGVGLALLQQTRPAAWARLVARPWLLVVLGSLLVATGLVLYQDLASLPGYALSFPCVSLGFGAWVAAATAPGFWLTTTRIPGVSAAAPLAFSLYLTHKQMLHLTKIALDDYMSRPLATTALAAALVMLSASALHFGIERPFLRWRDFLLARPDGAKAIRKTAEDAAAS